MSTPFGAHHGSSNTPPNRPGWALFELGFRPFYVLAALLATASLPVWVAQLFGVLPARGYFSGVLWHAHEMVFGFAIAVVCGFLFTAVRNWTGLPTPSGMKLASLAAVWVAGRIAMITGPGALAAIVDVAFLPLVAGCLWQPLHKARNRNRFFVGILLAIGAINASFHLACAGILDVAPLRFVESALGIVLLVVAIMAGRIVPMFTRNAVRSARIRSIRGLDGAAVATLAVTWSAWMVGAPDAIVGVSAVLAAIVHGLRLWTWDPRATRARPILWILHVSYAWMPIGFGLLAAASFGAMGTPAVALHAFAAGAMGGMIIGMMTRTARGHTGMPLQVGRIEVASYLLVHVGAALRVFGPLLAPADYGPVVALAAACWSGAFALYCIVYLPLLSRPRSDGKPG